MENVVKVIPKKYGYIEDAACGAGSCKDGVDTIIFSTFQSIKEAQDANKNSI